MRFLAAFTPILLLTFSSFQLNACSCAYLPFCEWIGYSEEWEYDYALVLAQKVAVSDIGMKIQVLEVYEGEVDAFELDLDLWVNTSCMIWHEQWNELDEYVFVVSKNVGYDGIEYSLSPCASVSLRRQGEFLFGDVADGITSISIQELGSLSGCPELNPLSPPPLEAFVMNPIEDELSFSLLESFAGALSIKIFDLNGRLILEEFMTIEEGHEKTNLQVNDIPAGLYFLQLEGTRARSAYKIIKT